MLLQQAALSIDQPSNRVHLQVPQFLLLQPIPYIPLARLPVMIQLPVPHLPHETLVLSAALPYSPKMHTFNKLFSDFLGLVYMLLLALSC